MIVALDAGHGGLNKDGEYVTPGKRYVWPGFPIYEGLINRSVCFQVQYGLSILGIKSFVVSDEWEDTGLLARSRRANDIGAGLYLSFHSNAGGGTGIEMYTSGGETEADVLCAKFYGPALARLVGDEGIKYRKGPGDAYDKDRDFSVLRSTRMPAVLFEWLFMDTWEDAQRLKDPILLARYADAVVLATVEAVAYLGR